MATTSKLAGKFITATKQFPKSITHAPWNIFRGTQIAYDDSMYAHSFRKGTMPTTVKLYPVILRAVEMYKRNSSLHDSDAPDYLMVSKAATWRDASGNNVRGKEYFLELMWPDGSSTVMHKKGNDIRISDMETDGTNNPISEFKSLDEFRMASIYLLCLPEILEADYNLASGKLAEKMNDFALSIPDFPFWASEADVPDLAKESAFFMDAIFCYANDHANWEFAETSNTTASVAEQVPTDLTDKPFRGAVVACSNPNVAFCYASSNGTADGGAAKAVTIGEAKAEFAAFSNHRKWSKAELMMIPYFSDDTPVMPETLRIAKHIWGTRDAVNPVCNVMWRGVTSYGKSTGVKQLACILNVPLLILTCHPAMEISEFKSTFVPESEDDGLEVDTLNVTMTGGDETLDPDLEAAIQHVSQMEKEEREALLSGTGFYMNAMMDTEGAAFALMGKEVELDTEILCKLYTDTVCYFREKPLRLKIAHLETNEEPKTTKEEKKPGFKHVISPYMKAVINGYIVEIRATCSAVKSCGAT